jgi:hypothetical protein
MRTVAGGPRPEKVSQLRLIELGVAFNRTAACITPTFAAMARVARGNSDRQIPEIESLIRAVILVIFCVNLGVTASADFGRIRDAVLLSTGSPETSRNIST